MPPSGYAFSASKRPSNPETASLSSQRASRPRPNYASQIANDSGSGQWQGGAQKPQSNSRKLRTLRTSGSQGSLVRGAAQQARAGQLVGPHALAAQEQFAAPDFQARRQIRTRGLPVRGPQLVPIGQPFNVEEQMTEAKSQFERIVALWTQSSSSDCVIPQNH